MNQQGQPLPRAFVSRDFDHTVIGNFMKKKYLALSQLIGKPETSVLFYSAADFKDLLNRIANHPGAAGIRVHFATYCPTGITTVDDIVAAGHRDLLTLIFCPIDSDRKELNGYYLISPAGGVIEFPRDAATRMVNIFRQKKLPLLQEIIFDAGRPEFTETNAMSYDLDKFIGANGLLNEMERQGSAGIAVFIGSYAKDYTIGGAGGATYKIGWQLTLIFEFARSIRYDGSDYLYNFDLEDTSDFGSRPPAPAPPNVALGVSPRNLVFGGDTGNPCPPPTPCSGTLG